MHPLSPTLCHTVTLLNDGAWHTGPQLAKTLGVSRTAIWKVVARLKALGVTLHTCQEGYRLPEPLVLLDQDTIAHYMALPPQLFFPSPSPLLQIAPISSLYHRTEVFEVIDSTQHHLIQKNAPASLKCKHVCLAEMQTHGRGRRGRTWHAPFGKNITLSLATLLAIDMSALQGISLVLALAVAEILSAIDPRLTPRLKWPNDLYLQGKKVGGILVDVVGEANGLCRVVVGLGLNVNMMDDVAGAIDQPWTSLEHSLHKKTDRNTLVAHLVQGLCAALTRFEAEGFAPFFFAWGAYDFLKGKALRVTRPLGDVFGHCEGITHTGHLVLRDPSGTRHTLCTGDTHILSHRDEDSEGSTP